jgi:hypothetical protein
VRRVSWIPMEALPGVSTVVTEKSKEGLPTDEDREKEQVLPPGSATTNSPRMAEKNEIGDDIRALPQPSYNTPDADSNISERPRTLGIPGGKDKKVNPNAVGVPGSHDGETPVKNDYGYVTRRDMGRTGYARRMPWKRQKRQRTWKKLTDQRRYKKSVPRTKTRMKQWYQRVRRNRTFLDRRQRYRDNTKKYKRQRVAHELYHFILLPDMEIGHLDNITPNGEVEFTLEDGAAWSLPVGSFLYLAQPATDEDEAFLDAIIDELPEGVDLEPAPEDVETVAAFIGFDLTPYDLDSMDEEQLDGLLEAMVDDASVKTAYHGLNPGVRRHRQKGPSRRRRHMSYRRNRSRARTQGRRWYQKNKRKAPFKRRRVLRKRSPNRYKLRYASTDGLAFVVGPSLDLGLLVSLTSEGTAIVDVPARGGLVEVGIMALLYSVVFVEEEDLEGVFRTIDETLGEEAYTDLTPEDVRECAILNDVDPDSPAFEALAAHVIGARGLGHAGVDDLGRLCEALVDRSVMIAESSSQVADRVIMAGDIMLYDQRPPESDSEIRDTGNRPTTNTGPDMYKQDLKETHKPTPGDMPQPDPVVPGSGSGKVIPDSLKVIGSRIARRWLRASLVNTRTFWHGTYHTYDTPEKRDGVLWLAMSPDVAFSYGDVYWRPKDSKVTVWNITLKPSARLVNLRDLSNPIVRAFADALNETRRYSLFGPISDENWPSWADFGLVEGVSWAKGFFRKKRVDGLIVTDANQDITKHDSVALLNTGVIESMEPQIAAEGKTAATIAEITSHTAPDVGARAKGVKLRLFRANPEKGMWTFKATGSGGGVYLVRLKAIPKGSTKDINKTHVLVSCSCDFFRWQGPEHWAKHNQFLYGKPRGTATKPDIMDPTGKHWACKHILAALQMARQYRIASETGWTLDGNLAPMKTGSATPQEYTRALAEMERWVQESRDLPPDWKGRPGNYLTGHGKGMYFIYRDLIRAGKPWSQAVIDHKAIPSGKAKAVEMAVRVFSRPQEPKHLGKWFEENKDRFALLDAAGAWPDRSAESGIRTVGPFRVHDTIGADEAAWSKAEEIIQRALRVLNDTGLPRFASVAYGDVYLVGQLSRKTWAAWYMPEKDAIYLRTNFRGVTSESSSQHLLHELGHRYWAKVMTPEKQRAWAAHHMEMTYSQPGGDLPAEGEVLPDIFLVNGKNVRVESIVGGQFNLADAKTGVHVGIVDRMKMRSWMADYAHRSRFPSLYAVHDAQEHFCEALSKKALGTLDAANLEAFDRIFG